MNLKDRIGAALSATFKNGFTGVLVNSSIKKLGGSFWKAMNNFQKRNYLSATSHVLEDTPDNDPHLFEDDPSFQEAIISGATMFINQATDQYSANYVNSNSGWPSDIVVNINKNLGQYTYPGLLQADALYQNNPKLDKSRSRRYKDGVPLKLPVSIKASRESFKYYDQIAFGLEILRSLPDEEQDALIRSALPGNTLSGYPDFTKQSSENMNTLMDNECDIIGFKKIVEKEITDSKGNKVKVRLFTAKYVEEYLDFLISRKIYEPFIGLARSHWDKVRAVFGGSWSMKILGCWFVAAKHLGYEHVLEVDKNFPVNEDKYDLPSSTTKIYSKHNIPYISQLPWDVMFELFRDKLPPQDKEGNVLPVTKEWLKVKYNYTLPPIFSSDVILFNVQGDDYSKFDTTVIPEDVSWLSSHKVFGKFFRYIIDLLIHNDVWIGGMRIGDMFYLSGHPLTANMGTDIHHNRNYVAAALINLKRNCKTMIISGSQVNKYLKDPNVCDILLLDNVYTVYYYAENPCILVSDIDQSDDSLIFTINMPVSEMEEVLSPFGVILKAEASSDLQKYGYVTFLQMHIGRVLKNQPIVDGIVQPIVIGNLQSRYPKLAHSERDIEEESVGDKVGIFKVTGDVNIDACISKLASGGKESITIWVIPVLKLIRHTKSGRDVIKAISNINPNTQYELYRSDVAFGMNPGFLGSLDVLSLLVDDRLTMSTLKAV